MAKINKLDSTPQGGENSEQKETIIETTQENTSNELFEGLDDDINSFSLYHWLLFYMKTSWSPLQYVVYKNGNPIAFVYSRSHDFCDVGDMTVFDSDDFSLDHKTEDVIEDLVEFLSRKGEDIAQEEKEKIEDLLLYYKKMRLEKSKKSKYIDAVEFLDTCSDDSFEDMMAQLINRHIEKVGEDNIGELEDLYISDVDISPKYIQQIEKKLQNKK